MNRLLLQNKTALITGGSSGIGFATARLFIEEGARCVLMGRDADKLATACQKLGPNAVGVAGDVSSVASLRQTVEETTKRFGTINVLFANAGMSECPPIAETTEAFFDEIVGVNLKGVFFLTQAALPHLADGASVLFTGSVGAHKSQLGDLLYCATKAAVHTLATSLALQEDVLARKIRVNTISPGPIKTPLTVAAHGNADVNGYIQSLIPLGRWGESEDVAKTALYLASDLSSYVTGAELFVDGGLVQR